MGQSSIVPVSVVPKILEFAQRDQVLIEQHVREAEKRSLNTSDCAICECVSAERCLRTVMLHKLLDLIF